MLISSLQFGQFKSTWKHRRGVHYPSTKVPTASLTWAAIPQPCLSGGRTARLWLHLCSNSDSQVHVFLTKRAKHWRTKCKFQDLSELLWGVSHRACPLSASVLVECCYNPGSDLPEHLLLEMGISQSQLQDAQRRAQRPRNQRLQVVWMTLKAVPKVLCSWGWFLFSPQHLSFFECLKPPLLKVFV